jgi:hypothetical protein
MRKACVVGLALLAAFSVGCAAQLSEIGVHVDLTMEPVLTNSGIRWDAAIGAYAVFGTSSPWGFRLSAGFDVGEMGPYGNIGAFRALAPYATFEADATLRWTARSGFVSTMSVGGRLIPDVGPGHRLSFGTFPLTWTLININGRIGSRFALTPNLIVDGSILTGGHTLFGETVTLNLQQIPASLGRPVWSLGGDLALSLRLTTHAGYLP